MTRDHLRHSRDSRATRKSRRVLSVRSGYPAGYELTRMEEQLLDLLQEQTNYWPVRIQRKYRKEKKKRSKS